MLTVAIDLHSMKKNTKEVNCFVTNILQMFFFCDNKRNCHKFLVIKYNYWVNCPFNVRSTIFNPRICSSEVNPVKMLSSQLTGALLVLFGQ